MSLALSRIEIESAGSDPRKLARALLAQLPGLTGPVPIEAIARALDIVSIEAGPAFRHRGLPAMRSAEERGPDRGERQQPAAAAALHHRP